MEEPKNPVDVQMKDANISKAWSKTLSVDSSTLIFLICLIYPNLKFKNNLATIENNFWLNLKSRVGFGMRFSRDSEPPLLEEPQARVSTLDSSIGKNLEDPGQSS